MIIAVDAIALTWLHTAGHIGSQHPPAMGIPMAKVAGAGWCHSQVCDLCRVCGVSPV
jgi:hypothetical protein